MIEGLQQEIRFLNALVANETDCDLRQTYFDTIHRYEVMIEALGGIK